jgi:hypothetical protein
MIAKRSGAGLRLGGCSIFSTRTPLGIDVSPQTSKIRCELCRGVRQSRACVFAVNSLQANKPGPEGGGGMLKVVKAFGNVGVFHG